MKMIHPPILLICISSNIKNLNFETLPRWCKFYIVVVEKQLILNLTDYTLKYETLIIDGTFSP